MVRALNGETRIRDADIERRMRMEKVETLETTLGDLIVVLTEEATSLARDKKEAYNVVAFTLMHLLYDSITSDPALTWFYRYYR